MIELKRGLASLVNRLVKAVLEKGNHLPTLRFEDTDLVMVSRIDWSMS